MTTAAEATVIHVPTVPPPQRHALIFTTFDGLPRGQALEIVNDHDPAPLGHHFHHTRPGQFEWEYLEAGPLQWRVRITRVAEGPALPVSSGCGSCGGHGH